MWWMAVAAAVEFSVEEQLDRYAMEPTISEVQRWAAEASLTEPERLDRWVRQSRWQAALPEVRLDAQWGGGWDRDWEYQAVDGEWDSANERTFDALTDAGQDADRQVGIQLGWDLSQWVVSTERIRVLDQVQDAIRLRDQSLTRVTKAYFQRRRLQVTRDLGGPWTPEQQVDMELELQQWTAELDQLTAGKFSTNGRKPRGRF